MKFSFILIILFFATTTSAEIYKWVDENGTIHFETTPPQGEYNVEKRTLSTTISKTNKKENIIKTPAIVFDNNQPIEEIKHIAIYNPDSSRECITAKEEYKKLVEWDKYRKSNGRIKDNFASKHAKELSESKYKMNTACGRNENVNKNELAQQKNIEEMQERRRSVAIMEANEEQQDQQQRANSGPIKILPNGVAINTGSGEFLAPNGNGFVGTQSGDFYKPVPNGLLNTNSGGITPAFR